MLPNTILGIFAAVSLSIYTVLTLMIILKFQKVKSRQIISLTLTMVITIISFAGCITINKTVENITHSKSSISRRSEKTYRRPLLKRQNTILSKFIQNGVYFLGI